MLIRRNILLTGVALVVAGVGGMYLTRDEPGTHEYFATEGIALRGADPVAYFTQGEPVIGSAEFSYDWSGVTWHFASASHRDRFAADPLAYAPQYGGYCAWAVAEKQQLYSTQPENWTVVDGKLYLNYSDGVEETWNTDRAGFITRGDAAWPEVRKLLM